MYEREGLIFFVRFNAISPLSANPVISRQVSYQLGHVETSLHALNKGAIQPAHPRSRISAFVIRNLESNISNFAPDKLSIF